MSRYYGTVQITLRGWFDADEIEEIRNDPMECASNVVIETGIIDMELGDDDE